MLRANCDEIHNCVQLSGWKQHPATCVHTHSLFTPYTLHTHTHSSHHTLFTHTHTQRGLTSLHDVCVEGHTRIALLLLAIGAFLMARTKEGWTCLMCAASNGHLQLAQILIAAGCDINSSTKLLELFEHSKIIVGCSIDCSVFPSFPPDWTNGTSHSSMEGPC